MGLTSEDLEPGDTADADVDIPRDCLPGTLRLAEHGCGYYSFLVVNGSAYGTVWDDFTVADGGLVPTKLTFVAWYQQWLDQSFAEVRRYASDSRRWELVQPLLDRLSLGMTRADVEQLLGPPDDVETRGKAPLGPYTRLTYRVAGATVYLTGNAFTRVERHPR